MDIILSVLWNIFIILLKIFLGVGIISIAIGLILCIRDCIRGENIRIFR